MRTPWRSRPTNIVETVVWDTLVCVLCDQTYIRPEHSVEPCPYCADMGRV